jgi:CRISPR/Cas system-associated endoribonuclease Cas2
MAMRDLSKLKAEAEKLSEQDQIDLAIYLLRRARRERKQRVVDLTPFYDIAHFDEDAMEMQKRWRAEWD